MRPTHIFGLTKREQRTVLAVVILIIAISVALHYRDLTRPMPEQKPAATPPARLNTEEDPSPNE